MSDLRPTTYRDAGVDIDAGDELVERIKPRGEALDAPRGAGRPRRLRRAGARCRWTATASRSWCPAPMASAPSCAWPSRPAGTTPSASTSWPCASTTSSYRAPNRSSSSTTTRPASLQVARRRARHQGHRRGLPAGRLRAGRRRNGRDARHVRRAATTTSPASASASSRRTASSTAAARAPATRSSASPPPARIPTAIR